MCDARVERDEDVTQRDKPAGLFVSVDIDSLGLYLGLYGGNAKNPDHLVKLTYELGVARFIELFDELGVKGTLFIVGDDLRNPAAVSIVRDAARAGHNLGNHTYSHPYDLIRMPDGAARHEITAGHEAVAAVAGTAPVIFRAPGYNVTAREYRMLEEAGYLYDSSPLPSYPYLMIKYAVMAALALRGKRSRSIWGNPAAFMGNPGPRQVGNLTVLPNAVTPVLRLPVIGTSLSTAPTPLFNHMLRSMRHRRFVGLEFHAIDLMDMAVDPLPPALSSQRDLSVPLARKRERFKRFIGTLQQTHQMFVPA